MVNYKKFCRLQPGKYVQVHQEDEPQNTIAIDQTVGRISLGPQYILQGGYFFERILTGKLLWRSHWTPVNMTEDFIKRYATFNTKGFPLIYFVILIINPSHPPTLISQMIMMKM